MSTNYNSRPRVAEVLVQDDQMFVIRKREDYEDLIRGEVIPEFLKSNHKRFLITETRRTQRRSFRFDLELQTNRNYHHMLRFGDFESLDVISSFDARCRMIRSEV